VVPACMQQVVQYILLITWFGCCLLHS
jgi:hypothetical protein